MLHEEITGTVLQACFEVSKELGSGFLESVYEKALLVALRQKNLKTQNQIPLKVKFRDAIVGDFFADILVENKVLIELKAVSALTKEHYAQIINYLNATEIDVGLLVNFGNAKLEYKRFYRKNQKDSYRQNILDELA